MPDYLPMTVLATQAGTVATRTGADIASISARGIALHVKLANLVGVPIFQPQVQWKDCSGNYNTIWTALRTLVANGDYTYLLYPNATDQAGWTEARQLGIPHTFRVVLAYTGNGVTDAADTTVDLDIVP